MKSCVSFGRAYTPSVAMSRQFRRAYAFQPLYSADWMTFLMGGEPWAV